MFLKSIGIQRVTFSYLYEPQVLVSFVVVIFAQDKKKRFSDGISEASMTLEIFLRGTLIIIFKTAY